MLHLASNKLLSKFFFYFKQVLRMTGKVEAWLD